jgi:hypothetical protein
MRVLPKSFRALITLFGFGLLSVGAPNATALPPQDGALSAIANRAPLNGPPLNRASSAHVAIAASGILKTTGETESGIRVHPILSLVGQSVPVIGEGTFNVEVAVDRTLENGARYDGPLELAGAIHQRIKTEAALDNTTKGEALGSVLSLIPNAPIPASNASTMQIQMLVARNNVTCQPNILCVHIINEGAYPVRLELRTPGGDEVVDAFTTYLIVVDAPRPVASADAEPLRSRSPLLVAMIVPIRLTPSTDIEGKQVEPSTKNVIALSEAMIRRPLTAATMFTTPETLDAVSRGANVAEPSLQSPVLDNIRRALSGRELLTAPYVQPNADLLDDGRLAGELRRQSAIGQQRVQEVLGFDPQNIGFYPTSIPTPAALRALGINRLITTEKALANVSVDNNAKPIGGGPSLQPVAIDPGSLTNEDADVIPAVLLHTELAKRLAARLSDRPAGLDNILRAQIFLAALTLVPRDEPTVGEGIAVAVPETTSSATLDTVLEGIGQDNPLFRGISVSELFSLPLSFRNGEVMQPKTRKLQANDPNVVDSFLRSQRRLDGYESLFDTPPESVGALRAQLASVWDDSRSAKERASVANALSKTVDSAIAQVTLAAPQSVTLTARKQEFKVTLINETGLTIRTQLMVESDNVELVGGQRDANRPGRWFIEVPINTDKRVFQVPINVNTRGPGSFSLIAHLSTQATKDRPAYSLSNIRYPLRSTSLGPVGTILTISALIMLASWWFRTTRQRRRGTSDGTVIIEDPSIGNEHPSVDDGVVQ